MVKFWIWYWSFASGMSFVVSITILFVSGELSFASLSLASPIIALCLVYTLLALKYLEEVEVRK